MNEPCAGVPDSLCHMVLGGHGEQLIAVHDGLVESLLRVVAARQQERCGERP